MPRMRRTEDRKGLWEARQCNDSGNIDPMISPDMRSEMRPQKGKGNAVKLCSACMISWICSFDSLLFPLCSCSAPPSVGDERITMVPRSYSSPWPLFLLDCGTTLEPVSSFSVSATSEMLASTSCVLFQWFATSFHGLQSPS